MPRSTRESASVSSVGEMLHSTVPTTNTAEMIRMVRLRPKRSERRAPTSAPITAPTRIPVAMTDCQPEPMPNSSVICSKAPEIMPVSYP